MKGFVEGITALNRDVNTQIFTVVVISHAPEKAAEIKESLEKAGSFKKIDTAFYYTEDAKTVTGNYYNCIMFCDMLAFSNLNMWQGNVHFWNIWFLSFAHHKLKLQSVIYPKTWFLEVLIP